MSLAGLSTAAVVPVAAAGTVSLDVSWMRPGVPDPMTPPAALRMGDVVTVHSSASLMTNPGCQVLFAAAGMVGNEAYMLVVHANASTTVCPDWTFVVPPSPPGSYVIRAAAWDPTFVQTEIPVTIEAGGTHVPFTSNFPVSSWALADTVATAPLSFGHGFTVDVPPGLADCEYDLTGTRGIEAHDPGCADWSVAVPELRPDVSTSGPYAEPMAGNLFVYGHGVGAGGRAYEVKSNTVAFSIDGDDGDPFASSATAAAFPAATNPYFVPVGSVDLQPALVGIDSGTCEFLLRAPSGPTLPAGTVDVVDGQCEPNAVDAEELGAYLMDVRVKDGSTTLAEAWGSFVVTEPIPAPTIGIPDDPPGPDEDVPIDVSVPKGAPTTYALTVTPAASCTDASGTFDVLDGVRDATATCRFPAAGTYQIDATMHDALGTTTHASRDITVNGPPDTVAPTVSVAPVGFVSAGIVNSGKVPVRFAWQGTDAGSGIASYAVELQTDTGAYASVGTALTGTSLTRSLAAGHRYRIRVRATDHASNASAWVVGPSTAITARQESSSVIHWHGTWRTTSSTSYWGGADRYSTAAGATASMTSTGHAFAWVGSVGPTRGTARVYVDGVLVKTIDLHASSAVSRRLLYTVAWASAVPRTITVRISGTSGHPRGDVDAFVTAS